MAYGYGKMPMAKPGKMASVPKVGSNPNRFATAARNALNRRRFMGPATANPTRRPRASSRSAYSY